jgi:hypothetical protein
MVYRTVIDVVVYVDTLRNPGKEVRLLQEVALLSDSLTVSRNRDSHLLS